MKKKSPPKSIRWGSALVKIYTCDDKGVPIYSVTYYDHNKRRHRKSFRSADEAEHEAKCIAEQLAKAEPQPLVLRDSDRYAYRRATELLQPLNLPVDLAAFHLVEAVKFVPLTELVQAARRYQQSYTKIVEKRVQEIVDEFIALKLASSKYHFKDLRSRLDRFAKAFSCNLSAVTSEDIFGFLTKLDVTDRTKNNYRSVIGSLFNYAKKKGYVAPDHPGVSHIPKIKLPPREVEVFTPDEMARLLKGASAELLPALAIGAFSGIRTEEIKRLHWEDVNLKEGFIVVRALKAKTKQRRLVPISKNLHAWLKPHHNESGKVFNYAILGNQFLKLAQRLGLKWKRNGLRHSYISYRLALLDNVYKVAREAGNSPRMIEAHYEKCVTKEEADRHFGIFPEDAVTVPLLGKETGAPAGIAGNQ